MKASEMEKEEPSNDGVTISEEFQKAAHELLHKANKHELKHVRDRAYNRESELDKAEMNKNMKGKKYPSTLSGSDMPH